MADEFSLSAFIHSLRLLARATCRKQARAGKSSKGSDIHDSLALSNKHHSRTFGECAFYFCLVFTSCCLPLVNRLYQAKFEQTLRGLEVELERREDLRRMKRREESMVQERSLRQLENELTLSRAMLGPRETAARTDAKTAPDGPLTTADLELDHPSTSRSRSKQSNPKPSHVHFKSPSRLSSLHHEDRPRVTLRSTRSSHRSTSSHKTGKH
jgi:hypothetical protein